MQRKRVVLILILSIVLVIPLVPSTSSSTIINDATDSVNMINDDIPEVIPDSLSIPNESATPAEISWNWAPTTTLYNDPYGTHDNPLNLGDDDGLLCRLSEEYDGSNYQIDLRFRTSTEVYAYQYQNHELRMDFTQVWSFFPEDLRFYVCIATATGTEGTYTFVGQISNPGVYTFDLGNDILFDDSISTPRYLFIRIQGAFEVGGDGTGNSYDFDYLGIAYRYHIPHITDVGWDAAEGNFNLYPHYGLSGRNYAVCSATYDCLDGGSEISSFEYAYDDAVHSGGWTVMYTSGSFVMVYTGIADSSWASLVPSACSISTTSTSRTFTFGVLIEWSHPRGFSLSTPNTIQASTSIVQSLEFHKEYCVYPGLSMQLVPVISESRVNAGSTCTYSGDVAYTGSSVHYWSPLVSEVDIQVRRTSPSPTDWIYTAQPASDGTFTVSPSTASTSGTNTFELRVVADGTTTNLLTTTCSDAVIGDRVIVSSGTIGSDNFNSVYGGGVRNTGQADILFLELEWESSSVPITSATVSWASSENTLSMSYVTDCWEGDTYARSSVGELTYNDLTVIVDGTDFVVVTEPSYSVLWDEIEILTTLIQGGDDHVNIGDTVFIEVTAELVHMGHALDSNSDTLYMNGVEMDHIEGIFRCTISHSNPGQWIFSVDDLNALEDTFGITKIAAGKPSISCAWDTFLVDLSVDDARISVNDIVRIWAHVVRAYDGSSFTDSMGTVILRHAGSSDISMIYSSIDGMWYVDVSQSSANKFTYYIHSILDSAEQIDTIGRSLDFDGIDDYVDCGSDSSLNLTSTLTLSAWFYGDCVDWGPGMYLLAKKDNNNAQYSLYIHSDGSLRFIWQNFVTWEVILQSEISRKDWHHVIVTVSGTILNAWYDGVHVRKDSQLLVPLVSFSSVPLYIGAQKSGASTSYHFQGFISEVRIYDYVLSEIQCDELYRGKSPDNSGMRLHLGRTSIDLSISLWNDLSQFENIGIIHGATVSIGYFPMYDVDVVNPIWDGVIITITGPTSQSLSLGQNASGIYVSAFYAYDGASFDGKFQMNNSLYSYDTPGRRGYTVETISEDTYGITVIILNDDTFAIWVLQQTILHLDTFDRNYFFKGV